MPDDAKDFLTPAEAAKPLRVSPRFLLRCVRAGTLPAMQLGPRTTRIHRDDLKAFATRFKFLHAAALDREQRPEA